MLHLPVKQNYYQIPIYDLLYFQTIETSSAGRRRRKANSEVDSGAEEPTATSSSDDKSGLCPFSHAFRNLYIFQTIVLI